MTGQELRRATLSSAAGRQVELVVVRPDHTLANVRVLKDAELLWRSQALALPEGDVRFHAEFAAEVAFLAAQKLGEWSEEPTRYLIVVGLEAGTDTVLGVNTAYWVPEEQSWYMAVGATRPQDQPGYPNPDRLRGIGLELTGALVACMNEIVCAPVTLEPLDDDARRFWLARGFHDGTGSDELRITCPESRELAARLAHSEADDPDAGDVPMFTDHRLISR